MKVYFNKKIRTNVFIVAGKAVQFEPIADNQGVIALEENDANKDLISALNEAAAKGRGGIVKLRSEQEYLDIKKKHPIASERSALDSQRRKQMLQISPVFPSKPRAQGASPVAIDPAPVPALPAKTSDKSNSPKDEKGLLLDGPTLEEYVARGYKADTYPPSGYAPRTTSAATDPALKSFRPRTGKKPAEKSAADLLNE